MRSVDLVFSSYLAGGFFYLLSAAAVFLRRAYHPKASRLAFLYSLFAATFSFVLALKQSGSLETLNEDLLSHIPVFGLYILAIVFLFLSRAFLRAGGVGWTWWILGIAGVGGVFILEANLFGWQNSIALGGWLAMTRQTTVSALLIAGWAVFMGGSTVFTARQFRGTSRYYTAITYWVIVLILVVLGDGIFIFGLPAAGYLVHLLGIILAVLVVSVPRLPEINRLVRRSLSYLIFTIVAVVFYMIGLVVAQLFFRDWPELNPIYNGLVLALVLVLLFNPLLNRVQKRVNMWAAGVEQDYTDLLRQYSQTITDTLDLKRLAAFAVETASEFLGVRRGFLFLVDIEKENNGQMVFALRGVKGMGKENPENGRLEETSPLAAYFRREYRPLVQSDVDLLPRFRDIPAGERAWLDGLGAEVYVPIYAKNEWIGLLALGSKGSGAEYSRQDLSLLSTMADQTAVALENTRLVEGLVRLNEDFRKAYNALDRANQHLERLDKTKSDFINIASHELRTPLMLVRGSTQLLLEETQFQEDAYFEQLLSKIESGAERLQEIMDSMTDIAKIDTRDLRLEEQEVSIQGLMESVCSELAEAADKRNQKLEMRDLDELQPVAGDMAALQKVFYHLIVNAIKYTPDGGEITISGSAVEPNLTEFPNGGVEIIVRDTGIGIDPRFHDLIFVKFYQTGELALHSSGKTKYKGGGPGLGLAIARGIVEAHQGKIWVESEGYDEENCPGSEFHVILPLRQIDRDQIETRIMTPE